MIDFSLFSWIKRNGRSVLINTRNRAQEFKEKTKEAKNGPRSKRKSLLLGFTTAVGLFGITLFTPALPAVAKDVAKPTPGKPNGIIPSPKQQLPSDKIIEGIAGVAAAVCGLAVTSGSFLVGGICGIVVVYGVLKA